MRRLLVFALVTVAVVALATRFEADRSVPEGPLRVVTGDPVRVVLPVDASVAMIEQRSHAAVLSAAELEQGTEMRAELARLAADDATLREIAETGHAALSSGRAAALAFPWFRVDASGDRPVVHAVTIELVPASAHIALSRDHEDGHAEVNDQLALRCGPGFATEAVDQGLRGVRLEQAITTSLISAANEAHDVYHRLVRGAPVGSHVRFARQAASEVASTRCG